MLVPSHAAAGSFLRYRLVHKIFQFGSAETNDFCIRWSRIRQPRIGKFIRILRRAIERYLEWHRIFSSPRVLVKAASISGFWGDVITPVALPL
jgi:hypothetical protein